MQFKQNDFMVRLASILQCFKFKCRYLPGPTGLWYRSLKRVKCALYSRNSVAKPATRRIQAILLGSRAYQRFQHLVGHLDGVLIHLVALDDQRPAHHILQQPAIAMVLRAHLAGGRGDGLHFRRAELHVVAWPQLQNASCRGL